MPLFILTKYDFDSMENHRPESSEVLGILEAEDQDAANQQGRAYCTAIGLKLETFEGYNGLKYPHIAALRAPKL